MLSFSSFSQDFSNDDTKLEYNVDAEKGIAMEGYLFKRASNAFKTWNRYNRRTSVTIFMNILNVQADCGFKKTDCHQRY